MINLDFGCQEARVKRVSELLPSTYVWEKGLQDFLVLYWEDLEYLCPQPDSNQDLPPRNTRDW